jgi:hypothetical protein
MTKLFKNSFVIPTEGGTCFSLETTTLPKPTNDAGRKAAKDYSP